MNEIRLGRFSIKSEPGRLILLEKNQIYYIQAEGDRADGAEERLPAC
ncbi:MAG: hypothetical protein IIA89_08235 [Chloroflexi bacterium]|nr:hypothetical protein [Chloroflexota bacterium]